MQGFHCAVCGEYHPEPPLAFGAEAPFAYYQVPEGEREARTVLSSDQCVLDQQRFFIRGQLELPIEASDDFFTWGIWVEVNEADFWRMGDLWEVEGREAEPPYACRIATALPVYGEPTLDLPATLQTRPLGVRPAVRLEPGPGALVQEQQGGVSWERVRTLVSATLHGSS